MLSHWPIRTKLRLGLGLLFLMVLGLFFSASYGLYAYRSLLRTLAARSSELPLASRARGHVGDMRNTLALAKEQMIHADQLGGLAEKLLLGRNTLAADLPYLNITFRTQFHEFNESLEKYRDQLDLNKAEADDRLGDDRRERETLAKIETLLKELDSGDPGSQLDANWLLDATRIDRAQDHVGQLLQLVAELPTHFHDRLQELQGEVRARYRTAIVTAWVTVALATILLITSTRVFYRWFAEPLERLVEGSREVAAGNFEHRIRLQTQDEMRELADAMNAMTQRFCEIRDDLDQQVRERTKQVVRSEQLASVGFLAAGVSHEINNPLASIALCSESLEGRLQDLLQTVDATHEEDVKVARNYLTMIQREAFRCKQITEKLLDFARRGDATRSAADLREIAIGVVEMVQHLGRYQDKNLVLEPGPPVIADVNAQEIKQVVLNLVTNGLESLAPGGTVRVVVECVGDQARFVVQDDGCGMSEEVMKHLFEPFFTRRRNGQGTGLGLSITHRIIEEHGGSIAAASEGEDRGSRFIVSLAAAATNKENRHRYQAA